MSIQARYTSDTAVHRVPRRKLAYQRQLRARYREEGRCSTCGRFRDRAPKLTCSRCYEAILRSLGYQEPAPEIPQIVSVLKVHPRIPVPLKGTIATSLFYGLRRKVAA